MSRRTKQMLAAEARNMADSDAFLPVLLLAGVDVEHCSEAQFLEIISSIEELCANKAAEDRAKYVEQVYHRMLQVLSTQVPIPTHQINNTVKQFVTYHPSMAVLTLDDLKHLGVTMERRSLIIHFDMSGSMSGSGFAPLVRTVTGFCTRLQSQGVEVYVSLFGSEVQENIHKQFNDRLLTLEEFVKGNYQPGGGTAFCPSFERTKNFGSAYDAIIISDGDFTDNISQLAFQEQCKTIFFVAPPWSPKGVEQRHAKSIASSVHAHVPYIGIASEQYVQLDTIIEGFMRDHHSFAKLAGFTAVGQYILPSNLLAPTEMIRTFKACLAQGEIVSSFFVKKLLGLFRYLEETAKLNFERCLQGIEFQSLMSLITPLVKTAYGELESSASCQQLYGYLSNILNIFVNEKQKLISRLGADEKTKAEVNQFWDNAMSFSEKDLIIADNEKKYGAPVGYLNLRVDSLTCTSDMLAEALQNLKVIYALMDLDLFGLVLDLLCSCRINEKPLPGPEAFTIPVWRKPDRTVDLLSILRMLPLALQQFQYSQNIPLSNVWTLQPTAATRLAWVMDVSGRVFPDFITSALPSLVAPNAFLTDLNLDENRTGFWSKIIRELAPKIALSTEALETITQILSAHVLKNFLVQLTDGSVSYEKPIYENVLPFIDTDEPRVWCVFRDQNGNRVNASTGQMVEATALVTDPAEVHRYYTANWIRHGAVIRPRYLTLMEYPALPEGAIELYSAGLKKDVEIMREQLEGIPMSSDQINAHIYTIRDRYKSIPVVVWGSDEQIIETVSKVRAACQGATIPNETVVINIPRHVTIDYLIAHASDPFIAGALRGLKDYSRIASEQSATGLNQLDYAIECGQKTTAVPDYETMRFLHFDRPGVREYFEKLQKKLIRALQSVAKPPQLSSVSALLRQLQPTTGTDEILGMADLETMPAQAASTTAKPTIVASRLVLSRELFTCPITLDIMENPATTAPCGHMFEMDAIAAYLQNGVTPCPSCRTPVTGVSMNHAFKNVIEAWVAQQTD